MNKDMLQPAILLSQIVGPGTSFGPRSLVPTGMVFLIEGMDAYPSVQPNNGDLQVTSSQWPAALFLVQQSQNFPGPFFWRGRIPIFTLDQIFVSASVAFGVTIWGSWVPDFTIDAQLGNG